MSASFAWDYFGITHPGAVRAGNEDAFLLRPDAGPGLGLFAVADGMGGHEAGEVASALVVECLAALPPAQAAGMLLSGAAGALGEANRVLRRLAGAERRIGSTALTLIASADHAAWLWAGDSRLYRLRDGRLERLTHDHRYVEMLVGQGLVDAAAAEAHPWSHVLTRAVGADDELDLDRGEANVVLGDVLLLCSDGLTGAVPELEIAGLLGQGSARTIAEALLDSALRREADDNVTAVLLRPC
jgi:serine/threonine protein phosphatase PrpC